MMNGKVGIVDTSAREYEQKKIWGEKREENGGDREPVATPNLKSKAQTGAQSRREECEGTEAKGWRREGSAW